MKKSNMLSELGSAMLSVTVAKEVKAGLFEEADRLGMNVSAYVRKLLEIGRREVWGDGPDKN